MMVVDSLLKEGLFDLDLFKLPIVFPSMIVLQLGKLDCHTDASAL